MSNFKLSRRHFITSTGTVFLLPLMESLFPLSKVMAAMASDPRRYVGIYFPNGTYNRQGDAVWYPATGKLSANALPPVLEPFTAYLNDFSVLKYLRNRSQEQMSGMGGHVSSVVSHFTAETIGNSKDTNCEVKGSSFDQYVVAATKKQGIYLIPGNLSGSYYPDAAGFPYGYPYMWFNNGKTQEPTMNPVSLYKKVLSQVVTTKPGGQPMPSPMPTATQGPNLRKSILDSTIADIQALQKKLGKADIAKLDDYFTSIREMEMNIQTSPSPTPTPPPGSLASGCVDPGSPNGGLDNDDVQANNPNYIDRIKAMFDVVTFAFKCDLTRAVGMSFDGDGADRTLQGIPSSLCYQGANPNDIGTHSLRHFLAGASTSQGREKNITADRLYLSLVFHLVDNLKSATDASGSRILDNTIIDAGFSVVDGNHGDGSQEGIPCIVAGGGNFMKPGYAYDVKGADRGDMFYTYSTFLNLGLSDFKGYTGVLNI